MIRSHSPALYAGVTLALLALLGLSTAVAFLDLGRLNAVLALLIASAKALLVMLFFMHLARGGAAPRIAAILGFLMLGLMGVLALSDYVARNREVHRVLPVPQSEVPLLLDPAQRSSDRPEQHPPPSSERSVMRQ
ncbi:MAG: cytochrome C oxidase subunit IV family protein [Polyangia bacterium]